MEKPFRKLSAFDRLRKLLAPIEPPCERVPIKLHLGEMAADWSPPNFNTFNQLSAWNKYPPLGGGELLRSAYRDWLIRHFNVNCRLSSGELLFEASPGTKQAISVAIFIASRLTKSRGVERPIVLIPNPFYPAYLEATTFIDCEPVFYDPNAEDLSFAIKLAADAAGNRLAAIVICNPGNPTGRLIAADEQSKISKIATTNNAVLIIDECYVEFYCTQAPTGFLTLKPPNLLRFLVLHTLSKRSGLAGLRSGFVVGDQETVSQYAAINRSCGVSSSLAVCEVAAALWSNDTHVEERRNRINTFWELADRFLSDIPGYRRPQAGFFLWLPIKNGEAVARDLWQYHGLMTMPGAYLGMDVEGVNPGQHYLRIALVGEKAEMIDALQRLREAILGVMHGFDFGKTQSLFQV